MKLIPLTLLIKLKIYKRFLFYKSEYKNWERNGKPAPPPHLAKRELILKYKNKYSLNTFVESGTYLGEMVYAHKDNFRSIYSIEIQPDLHKAASKRFKRFENIQIVYGDSGKVMPLILDKITESALFWLDGHYSGGITGKAETECPIFNELNAIFENNKNHILIIDDANSFVGTNDYPTIEGLVNFVKLKNQNYSSKIENNAIVFEI